MTDKEIIEVVQAHIEGKQIQYYTGHEWLDWVDDKPCWDFSTHEYRVKPESKVRPYKDQYECWMDMQKHEPLGWLYHKEGQYYFQIINVLKNTHWSYYLATYTYVDGSPFGIID